MKTEKNREPLIIISPEHAEYLESYRKEEFARFDKAREDSSKGFDNVIFIVGTGSFVLSITFITGLGDNFLVHPYILIASWIALVFSILIHAISYILAVYRVDEVQRELNEWGNANFSYKLNLNGNKIIKYNSIMIKIFDIVAITLMAFGIFLLLFFGATNFLARDEINLYKQTLPPAQQKEFNQFTQNPTYK